jgi:hypothetical protein
MWKVLVSKCKDWSMVKMNVNMSTILWCGEKEEEILDKLNP